MDEERGQQVDDRPNRGVGGESEVYIQSSSEHGGAEHQSEYQLSDDLYFPDLKPGEAWDESITMRRANELEAMLQKWEAEENHGERKGPFDHVGLNGAEVRWLAQRSGSDEYGGWPHLHLEGAVLIGARLAGADLSRAHLEHAYLDGAQLAGVNLSMAHLERSNLSTARLESADLRWARLEGANLYEAHLEGADLWAGQLQGTNLTGVWLDSKTALGDAALDGTTRLGDIKWSGVGAVNLSGIDWDRVPALGDEQGMSRGSTHRSWAAVARAYRQLATQLRAQGLSEVADRFTYRAHQCQRIVTRQQRHYLRYIGSLLLDLLAGYGYRSGRAILLYLAVILWFADFYVWASHGLFTFGLPPSNVQPLAWYEALILSISSFHGRGFQPFQHLNDPVAALAGIEAICGLVIEVSFIATFTQRFFSK